MLERLKERPLLAQDRIYSIRPTLDVKLWWECLLWLYRGRTGTLFALQSPTLFIHSIIWMTFPYWLLEAKYLDKKL